MKIPKTNWRIVENWRRLRRTRPRYRDSTGLKRQFVPGSEFEGKGTNTRYFSKTLRRRRAARKVAHESRRRNR